MTPQEVLARAVNKENPIVTTSFGPHSAVLLHMIYEIRPIKVVWVDTQFSTRETIEFMNELVDLLGLHVFGYTGEDWVADPPDPADDNWEQFVEQVKLAPFRTAMSLLQPTHWISAIRREETPHRKERDYVEVVGNIVKVSPLLDWRVADLEEYITKHNLPTYTNYRDPTKIDGCECGIHTVKLEDWRQ